MIVSFCLRQRDMDFVLFVAKRKGRDFVSDLVFIAGALLCCYCVVQVHYNFIVIRFCIPLSQSRVVFQLFHMSRSIYSLEQTRNFHRILKHWIFHKVCLELLSRNIGVRHCRTEQSFQSCYG